MSFCSTIFWHILENTHVVCFRSAFFFFCNEERAKVKAANPSLSMGEIARELGKRWEKVQGASRSKYEQDAARDKARYEQVRGKIISAVFMKSKGHRINIDCLAVEIGFTDLIVCPWSQPNKRTKPIIQLRQGWVWICLSECMFPCKDQVTDVGIFYLLEFEE